MSARDVNRVYKLHVAALEAKAAHDAYVDGVIAQPVPPTAAHFAQIRELHDAWKLAVNAAGIAENKLGSLDRQKLASMLAMTARKEVA